MNWTQPQWDFFEQKKNVDVTQQRKGFGSNIGWMLMDGFYNYSATRADMSSQDYNKTKEANKKKVQLK